MSDREKLLEHINYFTEHIPHEEGQTWEEAFADYLISNGVTVQQAFKLELEFTRQFIHDNGLEFALAAAWERRKKDAT